MKNTSNKTLVQLEGKWKGRIPREEDSTPLQLRIYTLYNTRIAGFTLDDVRFMVGQGYGLKYLIPEAIGYLKEDIMAEGNYYAGDLLKNVLEAPKEFWLKNILLWSEVFQLLLRNKEALDALDPRDEVDRNLIKLYQEFLIPIK